MSNGTFGLVSMAELEAAKARAGGVGPVSGYIETPGGAMEGTALPGEGMGYMAPVPELNIMGLPAAAALVPAIGGAVPALAGAIGAIVPPLAGIAGIAGLGYAALQALGLGEGEGLFGLDILGGDEQYRNGIPFGGPGLAEPPAQWVEKEWHVNYDWGRLQYYMVRMPNGRRKIALYNTRTKKWKIWNWRAPVLAVIGKNMPSHKQLTRLKRNLARHTADAKTILKITQPLAYAKQTGYRKYKRR